MDADTRFRTHAHGKTYDMRNMRVRENSKELQ